MMQDDAPSGRPRVQVSMSSDLLSLVRHVSAVTGESDSQVVLRGLTLALPDMVRGADEFRARAVALRQEDLKARQEEEKRRAALASRPVGKR